MPELSQKIEQLLAERREQEQVAVAAQARIQHIDEILKAYRFLVEEDVLPESDSIEHQGVVGNLPDTTSKIEAAIKETGQDRFAISEIAMHSGFSRQTVRRSLNDMVAQGKLRVAEKGFHRKPTVYERIKLE